MNTLYFITTPSSEGPIALEVHLSADGALDALAHAKESVSDVDGVFDRYIAEGGDQSKEQFAESFRIFAKTIAEAQIVPIQNELNGLVDFLAEHGMSNRGLLENIIVPPLVKFGDSDGASGTFMFLEDAYRAYDIMNVFESMGIDPNLMGLDGGGN